MEYQKPFKGRGEGGLGGIGEVGVPQKLEQIHGKMFRFVRNWGYKSFSRRQVIYLYRERRLSGNGNRQIRSFSQSTIICPIANINSRKEFFLHGMRHALVLAFPTTASFANTEEFENVLSIIEEFTICLHTLHSSLQEKIPSYNMAYFFCFFLFYFYNASKRI